MNNPTLPALMKAAAAAIVLGSPVGLFAQGKNASIDPNYLTKNDSKLIATASVLKDGGKLLLTAAKVEEALTKPTPAPIDLVPPSQQKLEPSVIAARGRKALIRVGWLCLCSHCDKWHMCLSGGYAVTTDGVVVTCYHCVSPEEQAMREGFLVAADTDGHVFPVTGILAADKELDTVVIRIDAKDLTALPVNDGSVPGDSAYVFSDPLSLTGYFSAGLVNRFYWKGDHVAENANTLEDARHLRVNVSTDWGPGSSGAAVMDICGNAIGHVDVITALNLQDDGGKSTPPPQATPGSTEPEADNGTILVLHEAIPARGVKLLIQSLSAR